jgi:peptide/nickel transport system ATP-binding protein
MRYGRIIESGHTKTIFETASHPYTLALMNSRPKLLENPDRLTTIDPDNGYKGLDKNDTKAIIADPKAGNANQASRLSNKASSGHENKVLFEVKNLSKTYSNNGFFAKKNYQKALTNVSFNLTLGENLGIVGESGSGKTTILRILLKLTPYKDGSVDFSGKELNEIRSEQLKDFRRNVQPVFQDPYSTFNPRFSIKSSLELACKLSPDTTESRINSEVKEIFNLVGLDEQLLYFFPHQLSGGQRQRAAIARALLCRPKILLMDEPTSALDVSIQAQVLNLIKDLQAQFKFSIILVTHDLPVVSFLCNRILVMQDGKVVETGETGAIIKYPSHEYTKKLIQSVPV